MHFQTSVSPKNIVSYLDEALKLSTTTSQAVAFALHTMSIKSATCMDEIAASSLDETRRDAARISITGEMGELLKHTTAATNSVYASMDLLRASLQFETHSGIDLDARSHVHSNRGSWKYRLLLGVSFFSIGLASLASLGQLGYLLPADWLPSNLIPGIQIPHGYAVVDIASLQSSLHETINAVAKINLVDNKVTSSRLRYLEENHEATGLRIDDIWEALGPPGPDGRYEFGPDTAKISADVARDVQQIREEIEPQLDGLHHEIARLNKIREEIVDLRRHVHRVDLRLTKRIDHAGGRS